jgi:hypothetical protein
VDRKPRRHRTTESVTAYNEKARARQDFIRQYYGAASPEVQIHFPAPRNDAYCSNAIVTFVARPSRFT